MKRQGRRTTLAIFGSFILILLLTTLTTGCFDSEPLEKKKVNIGGHGYDLLNPSNHPKLWIEVDWMLGVEPDFIKEDKDEPLDNVANILYEYSERNYIKVLKENKILALAHNKTVHDMEEIERIESEHRSIRATDEVFSLYILYIDGEFAGDEGGVKTLARAYSSSSIVVFKERIGKIDLDGLPKTLRITDHKEIERAALLHEVGRVLGLPDMKGSDCLMHPSLNSTRFATELGGPLPENFCESSELKLKNVRLGLERSWAEKVENGTNDDVVINAKFSPLSYEVSEGEVTLEYWDESLPGDRKKKTMTEDDGIYSANIGHYSDEKTVRYKIVTDQKGKVYESVEEKAEIRSLDVRERKRGESPGFGLIASFGVIVMVVLLYRSSDALNK